MTDNDKITFLRRRPSRLLPLQASISFNTWNDYNYLTSFHLDICDIHGNEHPIGRVKIAQFGMGPGASSVPDTFTELDHEFFSLGQSDTYYQRLNFLGAEVREHVLRSLRDIAADTELFERAKQEEVTKYSLLRGITPMTVRGQFHRMAWGGARLSPYNFSYQAPVPNCQNPLNLSFEVKPESNPPTNIHVLIGRNGVGKTFLLHHMTRAFIGKKTSYNQEGRLSFTNIGGVEVLEGDFANIVTVTFSAFDDFPPIEEQNESATDVKYSYIGLKDQSSKRDSFGIPMTPEQLAEKFRDSVVKCSGDDRRLRLQSALEMLSADPGFKKVDVTFLTDDHNDLDIATQALTLFKLLSSGHKIVLLTITKLVELVEEKTLVLLDEPEAHLHPPLLSAFIRGLSELLIDRNGVAIIATHSPVVLQEVPKSCVWKLRRTGDEFVAERPEAETFGENVGVLTREIFGLEVSESGFHKLLKEAVWERRTEKGYRDFRDVVNYFNDELGMEARAIVQALIAVRNNEGEV